MLPYYYFASSFFHEEEIFFSVIASRKKIIILSNSYINSAQDAFIFLNRFKFFFNLLSDAQTLKENKSSLIKIETIFPRYLFKYKKAFIEIVNKIDTKKIFEIGNVLLRAEILLKKNGENYISIVQRLLIKSRQIIK